MSNPVRLSACCLALLLTATTTQAQESFATPAPGGASAGYPQGYGSQPSAATYGASPQGGFANPGYQVQPGYAGQSGYPTAGNPQGRYAQGSDYPQPQYPQTGYPQTRYPQSGYAQTDDSQTRQGQNGYPPRGGANPTPAPPPAANAAYQGGQPTYGTGAQQGFQPGLAATPATAGPGGADLDGLMAMERQDYGVPPTQQLHSGQMHGPTPASIPGGQVITTKGLLSLMQGAAPYHLFDVLGGPEKLPGAIPAVAAHQSGSFDDQIQREFGPFLERTTHGDKEMPLVFYCQSTQCWMSYNAALRAIRLGYRNVLWYRGGIEAWQMAGRQTESVFNRFGG